MIPQAHETRAEEAQERPTVIPLSSRTVPRLASRLALAGAGLSLRETFVALHVDGASSLHAIAEMTDLEVGEVGDILKRLEQLGLVQLLRPAEHDPGRSECPTVMPEGDG